MRPSTRRHVTAVLLLLGAAGSAAATSPASACEGPGCSPAWAWAHPYPQGGTLSSAVWTGTRVLVVGSGGALTGSNDGSIWSTGSTGAPVDLHALARHGSLLVAVGDGGTLLTSEDLGLTWVQRATPTSESLHDVTGDGPRLVAVGRGGTVLTSEDGATWAGASSGSANPLTAVSWGGGQYVAVGFYGTVVTSQDGLSWTRRPTDTSRSLGDVVHDGTRFVAVGASGTVLTSPDGVGWTTRSAGTTACLNAVLDDGSRLLAVGDSGTVVTSPDGVTWRAGSTGVDRDLFALVFTGHRYVAAGAWGAVLTSPDAVSWTARHSGSTPWLYGVTPWSLGVVAVGERGTILTSRDGRAWRGGPSGFDAELYGVAFGLGQLIAVGDQGTILGSYDGVSWAARASDTPAQLAAVAFDGHQFIAVGYHATILTSSDGFRWSGHSSGASGLLRGVAVGDGQIVAVGTNGTILTSPDGVSWTKRSSGTADTLASVAWGAGRFVAVSERGAVLSSPDGMTWSTVASGDGPLYGLAFARDRFLAVGAGGLALTSVDGASWSRELTGVGADLQGVAYGSAVAYAVGRGGAVLRMDLPGTHRTLVAAGSRVSGRSGMEWKTDLFVLNTGPEPVTVGGRFLASTGPIVGTVTAHPGVPVLLSDVVGQLMASGSGAVELAAPVPLRVSARTWAHGLGTLAGGTVAQDIPVVAPAGGLAVGQTGYLLGLAESAASRTNIALTNTGDTPALVRVTLRAGDWTRLGAYERQLASGQHVLDTQPFAPFAGEGGLAEALAEVAVVEGEAVLAWASVIDVITGDPVTVPLCHASAAATNSWVPVAVHTTTPPQAMWRTLLALANPSPTGTLAILRWHGAEGELSMGIPVPGTTQVILDNVVGRLGGSGSAALQVQCDLPLLAASRTVHEPPSGGATGQCYDAVAPGDGLAAGETGYLLHLAETPTVRTNLGVTNTGDATAEVHVALHDDTGTIVAAYVLTVPPSTWLRDPRPFLTRAGRADIAAGLARVQVAAGQGVIITASVIDARTGDPTTVRLVR